MSSKPPQNNRPKVEFRLLGAPTIHCNGELLNVTRRTIRAIAFYLACQSTPVSRSDLIAMFWPDESPNRVRRLLRENLSKLRSSLPYRNELLITEGEEVSFNPDLFWSDKLEFINIVQNKGKIIAKIPSQTPIPEAIVHEIEYAISLWRQPKFLDSTRLPTSGDFDNWANDLSHYLEMQFTTLILRLIEHYLANHESENAFQLLNRLIVTDKVTMNTHYHFLKSMIDRGDLISAEAYCNFLEEVEEKSDIDFENSELTPLIDYVRAANQMNFLQYQDHWWDSFTYKLPYIGHEVILNELKEAGRDIGCLFLFGSHGIGKSRTAYELYRTAFPESRLLRYRLNYLEEYFSFNMIVNFLKQNLTEEEWDEIPSKQLSHLATIIPELVIQHPELPQIPQANSPEHYQMILETIYQLLVKISEKRRLFISLEDIQFADNASLASIKYLIQKRFFPQKGVIIMTATTDFEKSPKNQFHKLPRNQYYSLQLQPMNLDNLKKLVQEIVGFAPPQKLVEQIFQETKGNPIFSLELIYYLLDNELISNPANFDENGIDFPPLEEWTSTYLGNISQPARDLLEYCAVFGSHFTPMILETSCALSPVEIAHHLENLEQMNILQPVKPDNLNAGYTFISNYLREYIYHHISMSKRRIIALNLARAYENMHENNLYFTTPILANLYYIAGEPKIAFRYWITAADYAQHHYAPDDSTEYYAKAEYLVQKHFKLFTIDDINHLYEDWALMGIHYFRLDVSETAASVLLQIGRNRGSNFMVGTGYYLQGMIDLRHANQYLSAAEHLDLAIQYLSQETISIHLLRAKVEKSMLLMHQQSFFAARELLLDVLDTYQQFDQQDDEVMRIVAQTKHTLSLIYGAMGYPQIAQDYIHEIQGFLYEKMDYSTSVMNHLQRSWIEFTLAEPLKALAEMQKAFESASKMENDLLLAQIYENRGNVKQFIGDLDGAIEDIETGLDLGLKHSIPDVICYCYLFLGDLYQTLGQYERALEHFQKAQIYVGINTSTSIYVNRRLIHLRALRGDLPIDVAVQSLDSIIHDSYRSGMDYLALQATYYKFSLLVNRTRNPQLKNDFEEYLQETRKRNVRIYEIYGKLLYAKYLVSIKDFSAGVFLLEQTIREAISANLLLIELQAYEIHSSISKLNEASRSRAQDLVEYLLNRSQNPDIKNSSSIFCEKILENIRK
ncbi:MAG: AAA family ATPase [Anaerolineaceae bacterium]|nr:AAA family ATPase [Anaerolineaceae bacterium]